MASIPCYVGEMFFESKAALKKFTKDFLTERAHQTIESGPDYIFLKELVKRHPRFNAKNKNGMIGFIIERNFGGHIALTFIDKFHKLSGISWDKSVTMRDSELVSDLYQAMRYAVRDQTAVYAKSKPIPFWCPLCNVEIHDHVLIDVDHEKPTFKVLAANFIEQNKEHPLEFIDDNDHWGKRFMPEDKVWSTKWQEYHRERAKLRLICKKCNIKRVGNQVRT